MCRTVGHKGRGCIIRKKNTVLMTVGNLLVGLGSTRLCERCSICQFVEIAQDVVQFVQFVQFEPKLYGAQ